MSCRDLNDVSVSFKFDDEVITQALINIYQKDFNPLTDIEKNLFRETWKAFNQATAEGFDKSHFNPSEKFAEQIRYNNAVFSAFRVHRQQNDMAARLLDENGNLKPFGKWAKEVQPIADHYNKQWLQTEYNTAVRRAQMGAEWQQFEAEADVLPNLEWIPSTSPDPGEDHRIFWGTVRPVNDAFWNEHKPGDRWNCKCSLRQTDKPEGGLRIIPDKKDMPAPGLDNNPGKDGKLFSDSHPYFKETYPGVKETVERFLDKEGISNIIESIKQEAIRKSNQFIELRKKVIAKLDHYKNQHKEAINLRTNKFYNNKKGLKNLLTHAATIKEILAARSAPQNIKKFKFIRISPMGEGKDLTNPVHAKNVADKIRSGIIRYNVYEYKYKGKNYYIKTAEHKGGFEYLYAFTKEKS